MLTLGLDLSVTDAKTWLATVDWDDVGGARLVSITRGLSNEEIVKSAAKVGRDGVIGIDCPFGWPQAFVDLVIAHGSSTVDFEIGNAEGWREKHAKRQTDLHVQGRPDLAVTPLSVSADKIGHTAMRCATLLAEMTAKKLHVARDGVTGVAVEVYPAASLNAWGLRFKGYKEKKNDAARRQLVEDLLARANFLTVHADCRAQMEASDDAFDAVVASLSARAARADLADGPVDSHALELARAEGWIWVPRGDSLERLAA